MALLAFRVGVACIGLVPACCPNVRHEMQKGSAKGFVSLFGMEEQARHGSLLRPGRKSKLLGASVELGSLCGALESQSGGRASSYHRGDNVKVASAYLQRPGQTRSSCLLYRGAMPSTKGNFTNRGQIRQQAAQVQADPKLLT